MEWLIALAILGLIIGSFLNVVIVRLPRMLEMAWEQQCHEYLKMPFISSAVPYNLIYPPSHCPYCQHAIGARDNIPVISFILLKGRCRACRHPIPWRYPFVELFTALLSVVVGYHFGWGYFLVGALLFTWILIALSFIDLDHRMLPDNMTLLLLWLGLAFNLHHGFVSLQEAVIGAIVGYLFLWTIYWIFKFCTKKEGMGYGDFKLLAALGAWLGWAKLPVILLIASGSGAFIGVIAILLGRHSRSTPIPFGPFLAAAGWIALLWNVKIIP